MKKLLLLFLFIKFTITMHATFSLTGSTITQTGTDTNLSNLASISGVSLMQVGLGTDAEYTIYNIGNRNLIIDGELTIDASKEMLIVESLSPRISSDRLIAFQSEIQELQRQLLKLKLSCREQVMTSFTDEQWDNFAFIISDNPKLASLMPQVQSVNLEPMY